MKNRKPSFCDKTSFSLAMAGVSRAVVLKETESTNDVAKELLKNGCRDFATVVAERQTKGKGRSGKSFYSPDETGAYVSVALHASDDKNRTSRQSPRLRPPAPLRSFRAVPPLSSG